MSQEELLSMEKETVSPFYLEMAQYAAEQCTGCSDSPMILAFKAHKAMLEAHEKGENPLEKLNSFLGTSIPEEVLLNFANKIH